METKLQINVHGSRAVYKDADGDQLNVDIYSNGDTVIAVRDGAMNDMACMLPEVIAKQLRDFLNARFPT